MFIDRDVMAEVRNEMVKYLADNTYPTSGTNMDLIDNDNE